MSQTRGFSAPLTAQNRSKSMVCGLTAFTTPSHSALRTFLATMMATVSPVLTSWRSSH